MELVYTYIFVYIARRSVCIMIEMIERIVHIYVLLSFESRDKGWCQFKGTVRFKYCSISCHEGFSRIAFY